MYRLIKYLITIYISLLFLLGCSKIYHPWQFKGGVTKIFIDNTIIDTSSWLFVKKIKYKRIDNDKKQFTNMLEENNCIELSPEIANKYASELNPQTDELPYLVRGVVYGDRPDFTVIKKNEENKSLHICHASWNGENCLTLWALSKPIPVPIIIYLPYKPINIYPTAILAGDGIFSMMNNIDVDRR